MEDATRGKGIRADAQEELRRQSVLRKDARPALDVLRGLVAELVEAEIPASLELGPLAYRKTAIEGVLRIPPVHPVDDADVPAWPEGELSAVGYEVTISPWGKYVEVTGPFWLAADGSFESEEDDRERDGRYIQRFRTEGDAGFQPLSAFVERVRELAITREVALMASRAPAAT